MVKYLDGTSMGKIISFIYLLNSLNNFLIFTRCFQKARPSGFLCCSKAFDRVWHASLLSKLPFFGFPPSLCTLLLNNLSNRSLFVMVDGSVPQNCFFHLLYSLFYQRPLFVKPNTHYSTIFHKIPSNNTRFF